jgi:MFS family permease
MKLENILNSLQEKNIISPEQNTLIAEHERTKPFSIHYELRTFLYLGITLFTGGLGVLIYQNIDTIGHTVIVALIALITLACFGYAYLKRSPFSWEEVKNPAQLADFALLLGCMMFLILEGYLQYQYNLFGTKYGLVTIIPAIVFIPAAYFFDHRGVLSMGLTALASWVGVSIAPLSVLSQNDFSAPHFLFTAIALGLILSGVGLYSEYKNLKKHFSFTYLLLGSNLTLIACMTGMFNHGNWFIYVVIALALSVGLFFYARKTQSYLFLLMGVIYGYIAFSYLIFKVILESPNNELWILGMYYFLLTGVGVVFFLINIKKILGVK